MRRSRRMRTMSLTRRAVACAAALALLPFAGLAGCHKGDDGMSAEQHQKGDRLSEIAKKTGGDWNKVSQADRDFLMQMAYGNEQSARMLLWGAAKDSGNKPGAPAKR